MKENLISANDAEEENKKLFASMKLKVFSPHIRPLVLSGNDILKLRGRYNLPPIKQLLNHKEKRLEVIILKSKRERESGKEKKDQILAFFFINQI